ncbi:MAG: hypothetical protein ACLUGG_11240, partial [Oscillospiraceae bacterium]
SYENLEKVAQATFSTAKGSGRYIRCLWPALGFCISQGGEFILRRLQVWLVSMPVGPAGWLGA